MSDCVARARPEWSGVRHEVRSRVTGTVFADRPFASAPELCVVCGDFYATRDFKTCSMCSKGKTPDVLKEERKRKLEDLTGKYDVTTAEAVQLEDADFLAATKLEEVLEIITSSVKESRKLGDISWGEAGLRLGHDVLIQTGGGDLGVQALTLFRVEFGELEGDGSVAAIVHWAFGEEEEQDFEWRIWLA